MIDIAVIGAGPAGYSAAITARKRDQSVVVIGQNTGWLARAEHVANYPGLPDISGRDLLSAMANQAQALGAEPVVFTFDRPPKEVVTGKPVFLINSPEDRRGLVKRIYGIDRVVMAPLTAK